jgi:hypothetical protein
MSKDNLIRGLIKIERGYIIVKDLQLFAACKDGYASIK